MEYEVKKEFILYGQKLKKGTNIKLSASLYEKYKDNLTTPKKVKSEPKKPSK